ncbi:MAG TPA: pseudaminic acid synthase [Longimicrobiaceae bacterium]|nr:pseudaminic acid synthase [Longimicrobiaceae bacterium]
MNGTIDIGGRRVGPGHPAYLVAELSGNHNGDLQRALDTVRAAAEAGADAIKLQTYTADTLTIDSRKEHFVVPGDGPWGGRTLYQLYEEAHTPWEWHPRLFEEARAYGLDIFSTPFDATAVDLLEELGAPVYKVASFELVDDEILRTVAATAKPVVLSTGMGSLEEVAHAVAVLRGAGCEQVLLLRCTSSYPAPDASMNLATLPVLAQATGCPVGLSDHSLGTTAPVVAVTLGACFVEKHFTLSRADGGVDSHFSLEPAEFRALVEDVRRAEAMIGVPSFGPGVAEEGSTVFRRSLFVVRDVAEGEEFTRESVRSIRPGYGMPPRFLDVVVGKRAARAVERGTPLSWDLVGGA